MQMLLLAPVGADPGLEWAPLGVEMPHLHFHDGGKPLFVHQLRSGRTIVGRSDKCDVALPSDSVSRVHCMLERRTEGWWLSDRSRHGTTVNGAKVDNHLLAHGDQVGVGIYTARFSLHEDPSMRTPTQSTAPMGAAIHEELVEVHESGYAACRGELKFVRGRLEGQSVLLQQPRTTLGGSGAHVILDDHLPRQALHVRVVRGRVMIEPGVAPVFLAGVRVREITPAMVGEEVRVGEHGFVVDVATVEEESNELESFGEMVGRAPIMRRLFGVLARMSTHEAPVLLTGPSGTGKELAARGLHETGPRHEGPFVAVNCAAIADQLFESELFGHERGSFTGATGRQDGAFQRAHGGTLFLDEIGEMKLDAQAKLLRALESGEVRRVGGSVPEYPDVRVVAATNRNLPEMVSKGTFREDLYFRLAVLTVRLPSLAEREEDIKLIARTLLDRNHAGARLTGDAQDALLEYEWPGNVRELRNVLTRAYVMAGNVISASDLSFNPWAFEGEPTELRVGPDANERKQILDALRRHGGNRTKAARALGMPRSSLLYKLAKYGIMVK